jgi:hypothetical protein
MTKAYPCAFVEIDLSQDVTLDEDEAFKISRESHMYMDQEEQQAPREEVMEDSTLEEPFPKVKNEMVELERHVDALVNMKIPSWLRNTLQEVE